ncbi:MAG: type II secretion system protein, partial [Candidatus Gracilibacteria bacterium]|nr:type II secretion system protein [Candidatus Gracilibacteria bacterium]
MNKKYNNAFTLLEIMISMFILSIIIGGVTISFSKILDNFSSSNSESILFSDIKEFVADSILFKYSSGLILSQTSSLL